jgi:hypothetical protein
MAILWGHHFLISLDFREMVAICNDLHQLLHRTLNIKDENKINFNVYYASASCAE